MKHLDIDPEQNKKDGYSTGQILIAMPQLQDSFFTRSIVYICAHNADGAMGIVLNKPLPSLTFPDLLEQLEIDEKAGVDEQKVHFGGPVETARGFVLHSSEYVREGTIQVDDKVALTTTVEIIRDIAANTGPEKVLIALGYSGWDAGQLDEEIQSNGWLNVEADDDLLFGRNLEDKWKKSMNKLGVDVDLLTVEAGQA